jgi:hypothetical protein
VASASTAVASTPAAAAPTTATTSGALGLRPRFVHHQVPTTEILTVQGIDRPVCVFVIAYLDEGEPARLSRKTIADQIDTRGSYTDLREPLMKLIIRR